MLSSLADHANDPNHSILQANRVMSEDSTHYLLIKTMTPEASSATVTTSDSSPAVTNSASVNISDKDCLDAHNSKVSHNFSKNKPNEVSDSSSEHSNKFSPFAEKSKSTFTDPSTKVTPRPEVDGDSEPVTSDEKALTLSPVLSASESEPEAAIESQSKSSPFVEKGKNTSADTSTKITESEPEVTIELQSKVATDNSDSIVDKDVISSAISTETLSRRSPPSSSQSIEHVYQIDLNSDDDQIDTKNVNDEQLQQVIQPLEKTYSFPTIPPQPVPDVELMNTDDEDNESDEDLVTSPDPDVLPTSNPALTGIYDLSRSILFLKVDFLVISYFNWQRQKKF